MLLDECGLKTNLAYCVVSSSEVETDNCDSPKMVLWLEEGEEFGTVRQVSFLSHASR
jgi:hypothetical protein